MPLVLETKVCQHCRVLLEVTEIKLVCEACGYQKDVLPSDLEKLHMDWPYHHYEYMSLRRISRCRNCDSTLEEYFPYGRVPLDSLPATYDTRVFIGGNYEQIGSLRDVKAAVYGVEGNFVPILPYDDFQIPQDRIYEWDLRLLHNCKFAIFEVTQPGGELMEIARCAEYGVTTLLVYQARGSVPGPPRARTMLLQSGSHEHRVYTDTNHLRRIVDEFLTQKSPTQWRRAVEVLGYHYEEYSVHNKIYRDGVAEHMSSYKGLKVDIPDLRISELTHDFWVSSGNIIDGSFRLVDSSGKISWRRDSAKSSQRAEVGVVRFSPPLDHRSTPMNYSFNARTKDAYALTKEQLSRIPPEEADDPFLAAGLEFASKEIMFPLEIFNLKVEFPSGYQVVPKPAVYFGREPRSDGLKMPPDRFTFEENIALLEVHKPRIGYRYAIAWEVPEELPEV